MTEEVMFVYIEEVTCNQVYPKIAFIVPSFLFIVLGYL